MNFRQYFTTHTWWGKIIGGFLGYLMGGSAGALFGILIGNFFDRGLAEHFSRPHWSYYSEKRKVIQQVFFQTTFSVMGHIAKADGRVSEEEIQVARQLMNEMRLNNEQQELAKRLFNEGKDPHFDLESTLNTLQDTCRVNPELLKLFMDIQYRVAKAGGLTESKVQALDNIFRQMGFAPLKQQYRFYEDFIFGGAYSTADYSQRNNQRSSSSYSSNSHQRREEFNNYQNPNNLMHAFAVLEISPNASKQEVKKAYRKLISRNHPDKLIAQGLPEAMIKIANEKTQRITKAYEQICANKGW
ncbi:molecular chaperone DjlA [Legionella quinlivanii]|uniref:Co-chaperone protein DjlA n=1 Tax=Legionella quinlivanii TaxID=45073 RepID=A0A364LFQ4_9GAMM|nr:co-chaperone DjlA [Legionella quinlivanii]RAP34767.1 molecular chaperone DjlA [Legionella quinlivanii]